MDLNTAHCCLAHPSVCQFPPHPVCHCTGVSAPKNALLLDHIQYNGRFTGHTSTILDHTSTMVSTDSVKIHHRLMMLIQKALLSQPHGHGIEAPQLCPSDKVELIMSGPWPPVASTMRCSWDLSLPVFRSCPRPSPSAFAVPDCGSDRVVENARFGRGRFMWHPTGLDRASTVSRKQTLSSGAPEALSSRDVEPPRNVQGTGISEGPSGQPPHFAPLVQRPFWPSFVDEG